MTLNNKLKVLKQEKQNNLTIIFANRQFRNIFLSFIFRAAAIACNFLIVPLLINHFSEKKYGILITVISISSWFSFIDFGLANGLKNKISENLAKGDIIEVRKYVSTAYISLMKVFFFFGIVLLIFNQYVNWNKIVKAPVEDEQAVNRIFFYGLIFFFAKFVVELINPVLLAFHQTFISSLITLASQLSILCVCYLLKVLKDQSLVHFGLTFFWAPFIIVLLFSIYFYTNSHFEIRPSLSFYEKKYEKKLLSLGSSFFVIQIAFLIVFATDNLIIGRIIGYDEVSKYNIAYRYFSIPIFLLNIILSPYWPIFGEYYLKEDFISIKKTMKLLLSLWLLIVVMSVIMLLISNHLYSLWIGTNVSVSFILNLGMFLFCIISAWNNVFATFINSTSKLRLQLSSAILTGVINIPLSIYLIQFKSLGSAGVIFGTCICLLVSSLWSPIQCYKLINNKAKGIWNR